MISSVFPQHYVMDIPQIVYRILYNCNSIHIQLIMRFSHCSQVMLTFSQTLPLLLNNETYLCYFATDGFSFIVEATGSGLTYTCNITDNIILPEGIANIGLLYIMWVVQW